MRATVFCAGKRAVFPGGGANVRGANVWSHQSSTRVVVFDDNRLYTAPPN